MNTVNFIANDMLQRVILNTGKKIGGNNIAINELVRAAYTVEALLALDMNNTEIEIGTEESSVKYDISQYHIPNTLKWMTEIRGVTKSGLLYEPLLFKFKSSKPEDITFMTPQEMYEFGARWFANFKQQPVYFTLALPDAYTPIDNIMDRIVYDGRVKHAFNGILPIEVKPEYVELIEPTYVYSDDVIMRMMQSLVKFYSEFADGQ